MNFKPIVSIITVCYNSEQFIEKAIRSVLNQTYHLIEYIIVDGGSDDSTIKIIKSFEKEFSNKKLIWISEPDDGIYDAFNKGIDLATGDIIGILNSDDWYDRNAIQVVVENYEPYIDIYYANRYNVQQVGSEYYFKLFRSKNICLITQFMCISHPSCFINCKLYKKRKFDTGYDIAADYKFILESYHDGAKFHYIDYPTSYMRIGGASYSFQCILETVYVKKSLQKKMLSLYDVKNLFALIKYKLFLFLDRFKCVNAYINKIRIKGWHKIDKVE